jgi:predicted short-subunit dehydrogenase-like oxidoreductase (DUF2520 family)
MQRLINIIGCGRAAGAMAGLWLRSGQYEIGSVLNRSPESTKRAVRGLGAGRAATAVGEMEQADVWLIGTSDAQIGQAAATLAARHRELGGCLVFHLAGRFGLDVLAPVAERDALVAALHPVRSLTDRGLGPQDFEGTACVVEGNDRALAALRPLVTAIGGLWLPVSAVNRGLYHASVSIISNVTKGVAWKAQNWLERAGLPPDTAATVTHQLLQSTMQDLFRDGARQSITGPIIRGDTSTIEAHMDALGAIHPDDAEVYRVLARTVLELAQSRGDLDQATLARFNVLLGG